MKVLEYLHSTQCLADKPKIPLDLLVRLPDPELNPPTSVKSFASNRQHELKDSFELMTKNIEKRRERSKRNFDNKIKNHITIFKRGDKVLVRKFVRKNKVDDRFQAEIHDVISKKDEVPLYLVQGLESGTIKTIHRDHLILFKESTTVREPTPTIHEIVTWDNMKNKSYERDPDEDYQIKKQLNQKVALHFGESINIQSDYKLVIDNTTSEADIDKKLKDSKWEQVYLCNYYRQAQLQRESPYHTTIHPSRTLTPQLDQVHHLHSEPCNL